MEISTEAPIEELICLNPKIVDLNKNNRARWSKITAEFALSMERPAVARLAQQKEIRAYKALHNASSMLERHRRFQIMDNYHAFAFEAEQDIEIVGIAQREKKGQEQRGRATFKRAKVGDSETPIRKLIENLYQNAANRQMSAKEFLEYLLIILKDEGCHPKMLKDKEGQSYIQYDFSKAKKKRDIEGNPVRTMTLGTLRNILSPLRRHLKPATV